MPPVPATSANTATAVHTQVASLNVDLKGSLLVACLPFPSYSITVGGGVLW